MPRDHKDTRRLLAMLWSAVALGLAMSTGPVPPTNAQAPTATPTSIAATPSPTPALPLPPLGPPPVIAGRWSITRTWYRQCPGCSRVVTLTTPWTITQSGGEVRVDRGPRGVIFDDGAGGGYLNLEGFESSGPLTLRFWYSTLRVSPGGNSFEGAFNGSEVLQNPCGDRPPSVTCFASTGWLRAQRIDPIPTVPTPPGPPTPVASATSVPTETETTTPTPAPTTATPTAPSTSRPTETGTAAPSPSATLSPSPTPTPSATPPPVPARRFMPWAGG
jgi:hypothetical protein